MRFRIPICLRLAIVASGSFAIRSSTTAEYESCYVPSSHQQSHLFHFIPHHSVPSSPSAHVSQPQRNKNLAMYRHLIDKATSFISFLIMPCHHLHQDMLRTPLIHHHVACTTDIVAPDERLSTTSGDKTPARGPTDADRPCASRGAVGQQHQVDYERLSPKRVRDHRRT